MVTIGISRAVREEGTDGLDGPKIWEHIRSQGSVSIFTF